MEDETKRVLIPIELVNMIAPISVNAKLEWTDVADTEQDGLTIIRLIAQRDSLEAVILELQAELAKRDELVKEFLAYDSFQEMLSK